MAVTASPKEPAITNWNQSRFTSNSVVEKNDYRQMLSRRGEAEAGVDDPLSKRRNFDVYYGIYGPYAYYGPYGVPGRSGRGVGYVRYGVNTGRCAATPNGPGRRAAEVCSNQAPELTDWPIERIAEVVQPTDAQRPALDELQAASAKAIEMLQSGCPKDLPSIPTGRLAAMESRLQVMLAAVQTVRPALERFYQSLSDEQKARFNSLRSASRPAG